MAGAFWDHRRSYKPGSTPSLMGQSRHTRTVRGRKSRRSTFLGCGRSLESLPIAGEPGRGHHRPGDSDPWAHTQSKG